MNERSPDISVTCEPASKLRTMHAPIVLVDVLSPSNAGVTRKNVQVYRTISSVMEVLLPGSVAIHAELLRREPAGDWPSTPILLGAEAGLELQSIGFCTPLSGISRTSSLVP